MRRGNRCCSGGEVRLYCLGGEVWLCCLRAEVRLYCLGGEVRLYCLGGSCSGRVGQDGAIVVLLSQLPVPAGVWRVWRGTFDQGGKRCLYESLMCVRVCV